MIDFDLVKKDIGTKLIAYTITGCVIFMGWVSFDIRDSVKRFEGKYEVIVVDLEKLNQINENLELRVRKLEVELKIMKLKIEGEL